MNNTYTKEMETIVESQKGTKRLATIFKWHNGNAIQKALNTVKGYEDYRFVAEKILNDGFVFTNESGENPVVLSDDGDIVSDNKDIPGLFELAAKLKILRTQEMLEELM